MADLRRVFSDVRRVHAQLETAVSLRLRRELGLPSSLLQLTPAGQRKLAAAERSVDRELERLLKPVLSTLQLTELAATLQQLRRASAP